MPQSEIDIDCPCQHEQIWHNSIVYGGQRPNTTESRHNVSVSEKDKSHNGSNFFQGADEGPWPMPPFYLVTLICILSVKPICRVCVTCVCLCFCVFGIVVSS